MGEAQVDRHLRCSCSCTCSQRRHLGPQSCGTTKSRPGLGIGPALTSCKRKPGSAGVACSCPWARRNGIDPRRRGPGVIMPPSRRMVLPRIRPLLRLCLQVPSTGAPKQVAGTSSRTASSQQGTLGMGTLRGWCLLAALDPREISGVPSPGPFSSISAPSINMAALKSKACTIS